MKIVGGLLNNVLGIVSDLLRSVLGPNLFDSSDAVEVTIK
jgi:hypothetical protein